MPSPEYTQRWPFTLPMPLGDTHSSYELTPDALRFESDDLFDGGVETISWSEISEGATASLTVMGGRGGPDMARWVPANIEWLALSRTGSGAGGGAQGFMRVLPRGPDRDAIVNAVRARLGARWMGEELPLHETQAKMNIKVPEFGAAKAAGIMIAVLGLLALLLIILGLLLHPVVLTPAGILLGGWLVRNGLRDAREGKAVADTPIAKVASAGIGLVKLEGHAVVANPTPAGITGRPCVWWDASLFVWGEDNDQHGQWQPMAARHGGTKDVIDFEDASGRLPIWLNDAQLQLATQSWNSTKDSLPARGAALLEELGFSWNGDREFLLTEECLPTNQTLYVLGTLDQRRNLPKPGEESPLDRARRLWRSGEWRRALVSMVPAQGRFIVAVLIGFLDIVTQVGRGGQRVQQRQSFEAPALDAAARLVWKGNKGQPFLLSNQPERAALGAWQKRSKYLWWGGVGVWCLTVYQLFDYLFGR